MDAVEYNHWKYRVAALTREVEFIHDTVNMASAYRSPVSSADLAKHQADLDTARYLLAEANHQVELGKSEGAEPNVAVAQPN